MVTPFLLSKMSQMTNEQTLRLNQNLIENNAHVGAAIAIEYSQLMGWQQRSSSLNVNDDCNNDSKISNFISKRTPVSFLFQS